MFEERDSFVTDEVCGFQAPLAESTLETRYLIHSQFHNNLIQ